MTNRHPLAKAKAHHAAGRLDSAEALYRALLETDADHPEANHGLGVLEIEGGRFESALLHLQRALEQSPETGHYWQSFAEGLLLAERPEEALTVIGQALASGLDTPAAQDLRARLATGLGEPTPVAVPTFGTTNAVCVSSDGGWHSTKALIVVDADRQANDHERLIGLLQAGQLAPAETLARDLGARDPGDHFAWKVLGTLLVQDDRCQAAIPILELARQLAPEDAETLNNLGRAYQMAERPDDALALYRHALALRPEFAECWNNQGMTQHALGQLDASLIVMTVPGASADRWQGA
ncbi:tetratricopeptide repeat protein [uncultured Thiocystis sp.]|jgi:Flp pilus assembly protein TadD|uniref:tetratricopeptide repeat protein n=1 Tax=uncultured Thiocystis sp. TaxID=1202134 RepID=UPI0025E33BB0|nr:tetratricopeptide repeat protein [uncultured Thiocystis sp.]